MAKRTTGGVAVARIGPLAVMGCVGAGPATATDGLARLADPATAPYRIEATGFVTDASHPMRPGDSRRTEIAVRLLVKPELGETAVEVESGESGRRDVERYFVRRALGLDVETFCATWPLEGYGTKIVVGAEEMRTACEAKD